MPYEPEVLATNVLDTAALLIAAGMDPIRCLLFRQSDVKEHTELSWLLATVTAYGELARMHQFKEKSAQQRDFVSVGLFMYPVLQAADILAYQTDEVLVGDDQKQHLELARDIAQRFNAHHGETFVVPTHRIPKVGARVMNLQVPKMKMSTTGGTELGTVLILDDADEIRRKFKSAVTDSGHEIIRDEDKPGVSNLIQILAAVRGVEPAEVEEEYADAIGYAAFKEDVAEAVRRGPPADSPALRRDQIRRALPRRRARSRSGAGAINSVGHPRTRSLPHGNRPSPVESSPKCRLPV